MNEFIDFRFNDVRSLNHSLTEEMGLAEMNKVTYTKMHFLLLTKADIDIVSSNGSERQLEKEIWKAYIGFEYSEIIVASHWKFTGNQHCMLYIKLKINKCNWQTILLYLTVLAVLTVAFNLLSSCIFEKISENDRNSTQQEERTIENGNSDK